MPIPKFYLKKAEGNPPQSLIYLQMRWNGRKLVYSARHRTRLQDWDPELGRLKTRFQKVKDKSGKVSTENINKRLAKMEVICIDAYEKELGKGIPSVEVIKKALDDYMYQGQDRTKRDNEEITFLKLIDLLISGDIVGGEEVKNVGTIKTYQTAKKHLTEFGRITKYKLDFDTINLKFKDAYVKFLKTPRTINVSKGFGKGFKQVEWKGLSPNSIAKELKNIRTFMSVAVERDLTKNLAFKKDGFKVKKESTAGIYLKESEILRLYNYDLGDNKRLEHARDWFVFNCNIGTRVGDTFSLGAENIVKEDDGETYIKLTTDKGEKEIVIWCNPMVMSIFEKYKTSANRLPPRIPEPVYNVLLKQLCKDAGLIEKGRYSKDLKAPLYERISSHVARRSYITNQVIRGVDAHTIRSASGHSKGSQVLEEYIKETPLDAAKRLAKLSNKLKAV